MEPSFRIFMAVAYVIIAIPILFLNLVILVATWRTKTLHNPQQILFGNLAITDFAMGLICLLASFGNILRSVNEERIYCQGWPYVGPFIFCLVIMNLYVLALISLDRYLAVKLQFTYRVTVTNKRVINALIFGWLLCFSTTITVTILSATTTIKINELATLMTTFVAFLLFNIAMFCSMSFYHLKKLTKETEAANQQFSSTGASQFDVTKYRRAFHTLLIVLCAILSSFIPSLIAFTAKLLFPGEIAMWYLMVVAEWMTLSNSAINPLLYLWRMGDLRTAVKKLLGRPTRTEPEALTIQRTGNSPRP